MTDAVTVHTDLLDSAAAGEALGSQIAAAFSDQRPDALIVFASSRYDFGKLLRTLEARSSPKVMVGCSSAGEFTSNAQGEGMACAVALRSPDMRFSAGIGRRMSHDRARAASDLVSSFNGLRTYDYPFRSAVILADALTGHTDKLIEYLAMLTSGTYQFVGGGAGDDTRFQRTHVFYGTELVTDGVVGLEILSEHPIGIGVGHGWQLAGPAMRVTEADGMRLIRLNAVPTVEIFQEHAETTDQRFDPNEPVPFFLDNVIGIDTGQGYKLRVPLAVNSDGSITCVAGFPSGAIVRIMTTSANPTLAATSTAVTSAVRPLRGRAPKLALVFDCVTTRLRRGKEFGFELNAIQRILEGPAWLAATPMGKSCGRKASSMASTTAPPQSA